MKYVQSKDGVFIRQVLDIQPTQWDENNYCLARKLPPELAAALGVSKLRIVIPPAFDPATQRRVERDPAIIDGVWTQVWAVEEMTAEEAAQNREARASQVRAERDRLLAECDWIVIKHTEAGTNIPAAWEIYRQNLRDITAQAGFPHNVTWPVKPE